MYHTYTHSYINVIYTTKFLSTSNSLSCECNKISRREYLGKTGIWTFRSSALSFPGAKSPQRKLSLQWNFRSVEHSLPGSKKSKNFRSMELSHPWNFPSSEANVPRTFVPWTFSTRVTDCANNFCSL